MTAILYNPTDFNASNETHHNCQCGSNHGTSHSPDNSHHHHSGNSNSSIDVAQLDVAQLNDGVNDDDIIRLMPSKEDVLTKHSDEEFVQKALQEERINHSNLIASSREELPTVYVNGVMIDKNCIAEEVQYHPASNKEDALYLAAQALVVRELLKSAVLEDDTLGVKAWDADEEHAISQLIDKNVQATTPDNDSCERYYHQNKAEFKTAPLMSVRHILLACLPEDGDERLKVKNHAYELIDQINSSANPDAEFIDLARKLSACPSKEQGGELGVINSGQTVPEFESVVFAMDEGLAPSPVETRYGFHIVEVLDKQPGVQIDYSQAKPAIANQLAQQAFHHGLCDYLYTLADEADIEGIEMELSQENVYRG